MAFTFCTSGSAVLKAGLNVNTDVKDGVVDASDWSNQAEGRIEVETHTDWTTGFTDLSSGSQGLLADAASSLIAMDMINYDMSGYTSRQESGTMLDVLDESAKNALRELKLMEKRTLGQP